MIRFLARCLTRVWGAENKVYSSTGTETYSVQFYRDGKYDVQFYWDGKRYRQTTTVIVGPTLKTGSPLTTNHTVKCYMFMTDYNTTDRDDDGSDGEDAYYDDDDVYCSTYVTAVRENSSNVPPRTTCGPFLWRLGA